MIINTKKETTRADVFKTFIKDNRSRWPNICTVFEGYFKSGSMIDVMKAYYNPLMTFTPNENQLCLMELWGFDKDEMMSKFESKSKSTKYSAWKNLADKLTKSVEQVYVILEHPDEEISKYQRKFELFQVSDIDHVMDLWINMSADNALEIIAIEAGITLESVRNLVIYDFEEYKFTKASLDLIKIWGYDFNEFTKISEDKGTMAAFEYLIENRRDFGLFRNVLYERKSCNHCNPNIVDISGALYT